MQKQKENLFLEKFKLLNSQQNTEQIIWSSSESSDFDNATNCERLFNITNKARKRKRKLMKKVPKNISNLDVTIVDVPKDINEDSRAVKLSKFLQKCDTKIQKTSPTFERERAYLPPYKCSNLENSSPILSSKAIDLQKRRYLPEQSPILISKYASPKNSPKVRKKLFKAGEISEEDTKTHKEAIEFKNKSCSPILLAKREDVKKLHRCKSEKLNMDNIKMSTTHPNSFHISNNNYEQDVIVNLAENNNKNVKDQVIITDISTNASTKCSKSEKNNLDDSFLMLKTNNHELVKRVKSYFDSNFSSEANSQCSISDDLTPMQSSKTSDEVEILNFITQINSVIHSSPSVDEKSKNPSLESSQSAEINERSKKIHYKKGGLAYRLNSLLKKQMANISLWQHEKFMAENSNFVIPKGEHLVFRIQKVNFKYGCVLIQAVDSSEDIFLIFINNKYVQNANVVADMILKLYKPHNILEYKDKCKLVVNVSKFECLSFKL